MSERPPQVDVREAEDYVNSVMLSQPVSVAATPRSPPPVGRKRTLSAPDLQLEVQNKKCKNVGEEAKDRPTGKVTEAGSAANDDDATVKGSEEGRNPTKSGTDIVVSGQFMELLKKIATDVQEIYATLNEKIESIEKHISNSENRITDKLTKMLDKRLSSEVSKIRQEVKETMSGVRKDMNTELRQLDEKVEEMRGEIHQPCITERQIEAMNHQFARSMGAVQSQVDEMKEAVRKGSGNVTSALELNLVIRNLPESERENLSQKVDGLIKEGLRLRSVGFSKVSRKAERRPGKPGVVIVQCISRDDRAAILKAKKNLRSSRQYRDVYIHPDQAYEARVQTSNLKTIISALRSEVPGLRLTGNRVTFEGDHGGRADAERRDGRSEGRDNQDRRTNQPRDNRNDNPWRTQTGGNRNGYRGNRRDDGNFRS